MGSDAEARELLKEAEKAVNKKNMFFKKSPDWEKAAQCYQKAGEMFRAPPVKAMPDAVAAFEKAAAAHASNQAHFYAAQMMENAGNILRDLKNPLAAGQHYEKASSHFLDAGKADKGAELLIKAGKAVAEEDVTVAVKRYRRGMKLYEEDDQHIFIGDTWRHCLALLLKNDRKEEAVGLLTDMFDTFERLDQADYLHKAQLSVIILHLSRGDSVAAAAARDSFADFVMCEEGGAACDLIDAFEDGNDERVTELVAKQVFTLLDNQVARVASKLPAACIEAASDLTGARSNTKKPTAVVSLPKDDDSGGGGGGGGGAAAAAGGEGGVAAAAAADDDDDMDDLM
eukprot:CAMPEP_0181330694 /NCGR_PEP_ID=MMETSP1101-20121128/24059_1 /TAXON_ID=46948 /ORGANISM="Rhodomonas abbreviata, Strain Caron Lab Isolate" /LENGTH=341 /DNA_ID=CAMNT_0023440013 /DNA_START=125 /DNA_END=1150 /DNA_ORIENTATION=-